METTTEGSSGTEAPCLESERRKIENRNKALALKLMQEVFGDKNIDALDNYVDETYIEHSPLSAGNGLLAAKKFLVPLFKGKGKTKTDVQRVAADGDYIFLHWKPTEFFETETSIVEIWRLENGMFKEHWDVIQGDLKKLIISE
jgi:predicted SnoaL-like aldol condensation-catalyzing enzyme